MAKRISMNNSEIIVGNSDGLRISLSWDKEQPRGTASQATWGRCNLWIGDRLVWGHENPEKICLLKEYIGIGLNY
jgi:hypothetical protein